MMPRWLTRVGDARHPFVRDTLTLQSGQVALAVLHGVRALVVLRLLGPVGFGPLALAQSLVALASIADASTLGRASLVQLTRAVEERAPGETADALARFLAVHVTVNTVLVAAVWVLVPEVCGWLYGRDDVGVYARWLALPLIVDAPFLLVSLVLQATKRMRVLVAVETARAGLLLAATLIALAFDRSAWNVVMAFLATALIALAATLVGYRRLHLTGCQVPAWRTLVARVPSLSLGPTLRTTGLVAADKNVGNLANQLPLLLLGLIDTTAVAHLAAAMRVMALPAPLLTGLGRHLDVALVARGVAGPAAVVTLWRKITWRAALAWLPVAATMAAAAAVAIVPVLGEGYAAARAPLAPLLAQSAVLGLGVGLGPAFRALDMVGWSLAVNLVTLAGTVGPGAWLAREFGATGAASFHAVRTVLGVVLGCALLWQAGRRTRGGALEVKPRR